MQYNATEDVLKFDDKSMRDKFWGLIEVKNPNAKMWGSRKVIVY